MHAVAPRAVRRPPTASVGVAVWLASEVMFFAGLFAAYFSLRAANDVWPPDGVHLDTARAGAFTLALVASSATFWKAEHAAEGGALRRARAWTWATVVLGGVFLANQALEWTDDGYGISSHAYGTITYAMTGFHALHVAIGLVLLGVLALAPPGWAPSTPNLRKGIGWYWHFVDVVWVAMFATLFLVR